MQCQARGVLQQMWGAFLLYVSMKMGGTTGQNIDQPTEMTAMEGAIVQINCTYQTSGFNGLSWYQQHDGEAPILLSYNVLDGLEQKDRFSSFLSNSKRYSYLLLKELQMKDSASYLCAVRDTVTMRSLQLQQNSKGNHSSKKLYFLSVCLL
uniref:T cell receptor alpha variable 1-2 n=1 Tax=Chlorocebus sabaeus TaxID=60711 RepID=A0A0D9RV81_CHLSB